MKTTMNNIRTKVIAGVLATLCVTSTATMSISSVSAAEGNNTASHSSFLNLNESTAAKEIIDETLADIGYALNEVVPGFFLVRGTAIFAAKALLGMESDDEPDATEQKLDEISSKLDAIKYELDQKFSKVLAGIYKLDNLKSAETAVNCLSTLNSQVTVRVKSEIDFLKSKAAKGQKISEKDIAKVTKRIADINSDSISSASYSYAIKNLFSYINGENIEACMTGGESVFESYLKYLKMNSTHGKIMEDARKFATLIMQHYSVASYYNILSYTARLKLAELEGDLSAEFEAKTNITQAKKDFDEVVKKYKALQDKTEGMYIAVVKYSDGTTDNYYNISAAFDEANRTGKDYTITLYKDWKMEKISSDEKESDMIPDLESLSFASSNVTIDLNGHAIECVDSDNNAISISKGSLTIKNGTIKGGNNGIFSTDSDVTLLNVKIDGAKNGIHDNSSNITVDSSTITNCSSTGVYLAHGSNFHNFTARNSEFSNCGSYAITLNASHHMDVYNCTFDNNKGTAGGAVHIATEGFKNKIQFNHCTFSNNVASEDGGAVKVGYFTSGVGGNNKIGFANCTFSNNKANGNGGAIYGQYMNIYNCTFNSNHADQKGGALYLVTEHNINDCSFNGNTSGDNGGAVYMKEDSNFSYCTFKENRADGNGGAIYVPFRTKIVIRACDIKDNSAYEGGGLWLGHLLATEHELYDCTITGNTAKKNGGGIFTEITGGDGCADLIFGDTMTVTNNTANGSENNVFLNENLCKKCLIYVEKEHPLSGNSRVGISSPTTDKWLDVVRVETKDMYNSLANSFSSDSPNYNMNHYSGYGKYYWFDIEKV